MLYLRARSYLCLFLAVAFIASCRHHEASNVRGSATVKDVHGEVSYRGAPLIAGQKISLDDPIDVRNGSAVLHIPGVGEIRLFAKTRIRIEAGSKIRLALGKIWCLITELGASPTIGFSVETDNAVAGVRGTQFLVEIVEAEETQVSVLEGVVDVTPPDAPKSVTRVTAKKRTRVRRRELPAPPQNFSPEEEISLWTQLQGSLASGSSGEPQQDDNADGGAAQDLENGTTSVEAEGKAKDDPTQSEAVPQVEKARSQAQQEAENTKRRLHEDAEKTKRELKKEADETKQKLQEESENIKRQLEKEKESTLEEIRQQEDDMRKQMKDMKKGKSLKDF